MRLQGLQRFSCTNTWLGDRHHLKASRCIYKDSRDSGAKLYSHFIFILWGPLELTIMHVRHICSSWKIHLSKGLRDTSFVTLFIVFSNKTATSCNKTATRPCCSFRPYKIRGFWLLQQDNKAIPDSFIYFYLYSLYPIYINAYNINPALSWFKIYNGVGLWLVVLLQPWFFLYKIWDFTATRPCCRLVAACCSLLSLKVLVLKSLSFKGPTSIYQRDCEMYRLFSWSSPVTSE